MKMKSADVPRPRTDILGARLAVIMGIGVLISALSRPAETGLSLLADIGINGGFAILIIHAAPVLILMAGASAWPSGSGSAGEPWRLVVSAVIGGLYGMAVALFLDPLVRAHDWVVGWTGPLREANFVDAVAWVSAVTCIALGVICQAFVSFGGAAFRALAAQSVPPSDEPLEIRPRDRGELAWAALGMIGQGIMLVGIVLSQSALDPPPVAEGGVAVLSLAGGAAFLWSSARLWASFDELQRRTVMDAYAWSGILATPVLVGWAVLEGLGRAQPLEAYPLVVALLLGQSLLAAALQFKFGSPQLAKEVA